MEIPVLIEPINNNGFRARSGDPLPLCAEGATSEEAVNKLRDLVEKQLQNGTQLTSLKVGSDNAKLLQGAGIYREDDPIVQEWLQIMKENREKAENDPNYL